MSRLENAKEAWFFVRRGGKTMKVQGKDMLQKIKDGDEFFVQRGNDQFKFTAQKAEFEWEKEVGWYHIKNVTGGELKLWPRNGATTKMWDQDENPVTKIEPVAGKEYFVTGINSNKELNSFRDNPGINWDFGDRGDVHLIREGKAFFKGCTNFNGNVDCFRDIPWKTMDEMFMGCTRFNQDISEWFGCGRVRNTWEQDRMFFGAAGFTQNLSQWCGISNADGTGPADAMTGSGIEGDTSKWPNWACRTALGRSILSSDDLPGAYMEDDM